LEKYRKGMTLFEHTFNTERDYFFADTTFASGNTGAQEFCCCCWLVGVEAVSRRNVASEFWVNKIR